jgi:hypothetical protein
LSGPANRLLNRQYSSFYQQLNDLVTVDFRETAEGG